MSLLDGIRVVELGHWVAGPAVGGLLADWGAEVYKLEPPAGDPMRRLNVSYSGGSESRVPAFDLDNRGKRSVAVDLKSERGLEVAKQLIATADVFVTNLRLTALEQIGLDYATLLAGDPRLIYLLVTAHGVGGPARDAPGYDSGAFWARSGVADRFTPPDHPPPLIAGAFGDHMTSMFAAGAVLGGLYYRERYGLGQLVTTSLLRAGIYGVSGDLATIVELGRLAAPATRSSNRNPMMNCYRGKDGRWFWLLGADSQRLFPALAKAIGQPELTQDERFSTPQQRRRHGPELVELLDAAFGSEGRDVWASRFGDFGVWWAPVNSVEDLIDDPQAAAAGAFVRMASNDPCRPEPVRVPAGPIDFGAAPVTDVGPPPAIGEHTGAVLASLGVDPAEQRRLAEAGVVKL